MNCNCKYNFTDDGKKLSPRRDVPSYPKVKKDDGSAFLSFIHKTQTVWDVNGHDLVLSSTQYTLSQETIETLKKPTFDVWHWEHNEVCRLMDGCILDIQSAFVWLYVYVSLSVSTGVELSYVHILQISILNLASCLTCLLIDRRC